MQPADQYDFLFVNLLNLECLPPVNASRGVVLFGLDTLGVWWSLPSAFCLRFDWDSIIDDPKRACRVDRPSSVSSHMKNWNTPEPPD